MVESGEKPVQGRMALFLRARTVKPSRHFEST